MTNDAVIKAMVEDLWTTLFRLVRESQKRRNQGLKPNERMTIYIPPK